MFAGGSRSSYHLQKQNAKSRRGIGDQGSFQGYVQQALTSADAAAWREQVGQPTIRRVDSSVKATDRTRIVGHFAPITSKHPAIVGTEQEVDILIATDVLSEGHNLQDCGYLVNYDLHWNPTRMVQRAGRIDRLGSVFETLHIYNMFPEHALEALLGLVRSLTAKIELINQSGFLDASVLGEVVTPRDFNTIKRIAAEDSSVIEEQESFLELASSESLLAQLQHVLSTDAQRWLTDLDDGIHSGLERHNAKGMFFYFTAPRTNGTAHFWRYYDLEKQTITDNRYHIMQMITCSPNTPRFPPPYYEIDVFAIQDRIITSIIGDLEQQATAAVVDKLVSQEQTLVSQILHNHLSHTDLDRAEIRELRKFLKEPLVGAAIQQLRKALNSYSTDNAIQPFVDVVRLLRQQQGRIEPAPQSVAVNQIQRSDLKLICYEYIYA